MKDKTVQEVREQIWREVHIDVSDDIIRRDGLDGTDNQLYKVEKDESGYRRFNEEDVATIKFIALLRDIGISRDKIKDILDGDIQLIWDRINQLNNHTLPNLVAKLSN